jgi:hypothetical protein
VDEGTHFLDIGGEMRNFSELIAVVASPDDNWRHIDLMCIFQVLLLDFDGAPNDDIVSVRPFALREDAGIGTVNNHVLSQFK